MAEAKTNQYTNLQGALQKPQKVTLSEAYIADAFKSYGFEPTAADMHYWTTVPESQKNKLQTELRERKQGEDGNMSTIEGRTAGPDHLTDEEIISLYSKYGLDEPDLDWVRSNMPDDQKMLENILKYQRKFLDEQAKIDGKAMLNDYKQYSTPQKQQNSQMTGQGGMPDGTGGYPDDGQGGVMQAKEVPHFIGEGALVKFDNDPNGSLEGGASTVWYVDTVNKILRPFMSQEAFNSSYDDPKAAEAAITRLKTTDLKGVLDGFTLKDHTYGITNGGTMKEYDVSPAAIEKRYGQTLNIDLQNKMATALSGWMGLLKQPSSGISSGFVDSLTKDATLMGSYINSITYGDYSFEDLYRDIKRRELISKGDKTLENQKIIDPVLNKTSFKSSSQYKTSSTNPLLNMPESLGGIPNNVLTTATAALPDTAFQLLKPVYSLDDPAFKADMSKIQSAYHDILAQQLNATSESEKAVADNNYNILKKEIEDKYNTSLSDNALTAWNQIQTMEQTLSERGLQGSGIGNEQMDVYIANVRRQADMERKEKAKTELSAQQNKYMTSASPAEIQALIDEDKAKGLSRDQWRTTLWGLTPSQAIVDSLDINTLKQQYPNATEEQLQKYRSQILDENGNLRSTLYQNKFNKDYNIKYGNTMLQDFNESAEDYKQRKAEEAAKAEQEKLMDQWNNQANKEGGSLFDKNGNEVDKDGNIIKTKEAIDAENAAKEAVTTDEKPVDVTDYSSLGQKINSEEQLPGLMKELASMGIKSENYKDYIKKAANGSLYYTKPNVQTKIDQKTSGTKLLNSDQLTNARLALEKSGVSSDQFTKYITGGGGSTSYFNAPNIKATNIFNELNKSATGTPLKTTTGTSTTTPITNSLKAAADAAKNAATAKLLGSGYVAISGAQYKGMLPAAAKAAQEKAYSNIISKNGTLYGIAKPTSSSTSGSSVSTVVRPSAVMSASSSSAVPNLKPISSSSPSYVTTSSGQRISTSDPNISAYRAAGAK